MAHVRTSIRNAIVSRLTGLTTSGARVYSERVQPMADANLPGLRIYLRKEPITTESMAPDPVLDRKAILHIDCCAKAVSGMETVLDTMLAEVEVAIGTGDGTFGGLIKSRPIPFDIDSDIDDGLEKPVGVLWVEYTINYFTAASNPATAI